MASTNEVAAEDGATTVEVSPARRLRFTLDTVLKNAVFVGFHAATLVMLCVTGFSWAGLGLALAFYVVRAVGVTLGYHRYFSHRSFRAGRVTQFVLALVGTLSLQKGVLWWAAHHRRHHRDSDTERDIHSPTRHGLFWAHMGWIMAPEFMETDWDGIKDMARFPELRWLNAHFMLVFAALCLLVQLTLGFHALTWACFVSTVALWHGTFTINSLNHVLGRRVYATSDTSRNNLLLALISQGEGWHNNHHYYAASARQGFRWWQVDVTYYVLCALEAVGLVWDVNRPGADVVAGRLGGKRWLVSEVGDQGPVAASAPRPAAVLEPVFAASSQVMAAAAAGIAAVVSLGGTPVAKAPGATPPAGVTSPEAPPG